jgi:hypothetical protein
MITGKLVISLDFEIYWGVRDAVKLTEYKAQLFGVQKVIPLLLEMFAKYHINATFATVGFLFFNNKKDLINNLPEKKPQYLNSKLSPYSDHFNLLGENEEKDPFHFGSKLVQQIKDAGQEIGSHTFSHYYCLEKGQTTEEFVCDLSAAKNIAAKNEIVLKSFVFPRNQYNKAYLDICKQMGFTSFRGNEKSWLFSSKSHGNGMFFRRPFRLLDSYLNLSGHNCYSLKQMKKNNPFNIPSSRFLRPYDKKLKALENVRLKRITDSMTYAAKHGMTYHLWWHPHNFGIDMQENFSFLEKILRHFTELNRKYNFESMSMSQLSNELRQPNE